MNAPPTVAVVIPSWNSAGLLPRSLASLVAQEVELELLVVDNGSGDGTLELLEGEGVDHVALAENAGFSAAVNIGVARTSAPAVLVLNADTALAPGCLGPLAAALEADRSWAASSLGCCSWRAPAPHRSPSTAPGSTAPDRRLPATAARSRSAPEGRRRRACSNGARCSASVGPPACCAARCSSSWAATTSVTSPSTRTSTSTCEVRIAGWRFEYVPEAVVWHLGNASWRAGFERPLAENSRLVGRNRLATQIKFMPVTAIPRIAVVEVGALLRAARQRRLVATLGGKLSAFRWLPALRRDRRRLRERGDLSLARRWLGA